MFVRTSLTSLLMLAAALGAASDVRAQSTTTDQGSVGLTASLAGGQMTIMVPYWLADRIVIAPAFGVAWYEGHGTTLELGIVPRFYLMKERVSPYIGARFAALTWSPSGGDAVTDVLIGAAFGGEFFLDPHFSFGVESQVNLVLGHDTSVRSGDSERKILNTVAAVFATVYF